MDVKSCLAVIQSSQLLIDIQNFIKRCYSKDGCCYVTSTAQFFLKTLRERYGHLCGTL